MDNKIIKDYIKDGRLDIELIIKTYQNYIYSVAKNKIGNTNDAEEITSNVFFIFWNNYNKNLIILDAPIKPYLMGIANNLINKKYHENITETESLENVEINDNIEIAKTIEINEQINIVEDLIEELKDKEKRIFLLFYYQNFKVKEIARELKISDIKVKVTLHRLRKKAIKKLEERGYNNE